MEVFNAKLRGTKSEQNALCMARENYTPGLRYKFLAPIS